MKIGILTLPLHTNYGGILQAYALQEILKRMGYEVYLINKKKKEHSGLILPLVYIKRLILKYVFGKENVIIFLERKRRKEHPVVSENLREFIKKYFSNCYNIYDFNELSQENFDILIVGSDQIWRPLYFPEIENAYLSFAKDWTVKRISYAASFGTGEKEYTNAQIRACFGLAAKFDEISVREFQGIELVSNYFKRESVWVLDPTMLLDLYDYRALMQNKLSADNGIFTYFLDYNNAKKEITQITEAALNLSSFSIFSYSKKGKCLVTSLPSVEEWLNKFDAANFIITDSFHACVFSILYNKPFIVVGNKARGMARFDSLLALFGLQERLINSVDDLSEAIKSNIDWQKVNDILLHERNKSLSFLNQALK